MPKTGNKAAAVVPASWLPVAALKIVGAALKRRDVRSGPPPEDGLWGNEGGGRGGRTVVGGGGGFRTSEASFPFLDSQHTVPLLQDSVLCKMLEGSLHKDDIDWGRQNPGHFLGGPLDPDFSGGLFLVSTFFVMQHLPCAGHLAFRSISSQSKAKNPVTQVPAHDPSDNLVTSGVGVDLGVEDVVVTSLFREGITNSLGGLAESLKSCLETQHFMLLAQMALTSRTASQNPASLSATQTPGHFSEEVRNNGARTKIGT